VGPWRLDGFALLVDLLVAQGAFGLLLQLEQDFHALALACHAARHSRRRLLANTAMAGSR
jgi:hypothetical protein